MLAAKANMIQQFNHRNIKILQNLGYEVHVATNMVDFGSMSAEENERFKQWMSDNKVVAHQVDFERRMGSLKGNIRSIKQLRQIFKMNDFAFTHVHSPLGSILGRFVAKQFKVPTIYTAHGFHFFKGGPKSGWLFFFPIEWLFSFITNTIITINNEDYVFAKKYLHANNIVGINSNGVDVLNALKVSEDEKKQKRYVFRKQFNIPEEAFVISSVGELSTRKNHSLVLEALNLLEESERKKIYYIIAGTGDEKSNLLNFANSIGFIDNFLLLGYQSDIHSLNFASDISILPSLREGLGIAGLDATVDGTWLLGTKFGGVSDYLSHDVNGWLIDPRNPLELKKCLEKLLQNKRLSMGGELLLKFDNTSVDKKMIDTYESMSGGRKYDQ
ncbi:glycosyltransferase [Leuconostoc suionicum]|uniref:glycosyltransferase n=1 Tax=Leuconostoc suionicum TaxID=1511761 RepID=UPI0024AD685A|nr:glycosyltransferase [Leuconostoc suionicum]MDI6544826.1 glycosyltransferase [Leuconostoc suionicum]